MAGSIITFPSNGGSASGYLAVPQSGKGPGVVVIQEWWGLVDHIKDVCNRFAAAGFTALAPDLYDGQATKSPDEAGKMMMALNISEAEKKLRGAVEHLMRLENVSSPKAGVVGFCMGGQLALYAATVDRNVAATVDFYGIHPHVKPDFTKLAGPVLGIFAENDKTVPQEAIVQLQQDIRAAGKTCDIYVYPNVDHAFFNDTRPAVYSEIAASDAWDRTLRFLRENLEPQQG
ncbi:MAG TPA: dienelactone hydrolase family protein [Cytophagales bacterium]|jgi:carboxymethylenebutenolidase